MKQSEPYGLMSETEYNEYEEQMNRLASDSARLRLTVHSTIVVHKSNGDKE